MNIKELADIGAKAALPHLREGTCALSVNPRYTSWDRDREAREAFAKAVLMAAFPSPGSDELRKALAQLAAGINSATGGGEFAVLRVSVLKAAGEALIENWNDHNLPVDVQQELAEWRRSFEQ